MYQQIKKYQDRLYKYYYDFSSKNVEDETDKDDVNQGGDNSNSEENKDDVNQGGNNSNTEDNKEENNSNTTKPSNPQTGDNSILGLVGVGIASIAGIFVNNRRKNNK